MMEENFESEERLPRILEARRAGGSSLFFFKGNWTTMTLMTRESAALKERE